MNKTRTHVNDLKVGDKVIVFDTVTATITAIDVGPYVYGILDTITYPCYIGQELWWDKVEVQ